MRLSNNIFGQGYVKERLKSSLRKFFGRYGDLIKQYEVTLSRMLHDILDDDHLQWHPPLIRHYTNFWPYYWSGPYYQFGSLPNYERFPKNICNGCGMQTEDAYSSGHLVLSHFGTCKCSNVETNLSWTCLVSGLLSFEHHSVLLFLASIQSSCCCADSPFLYPPAGHVVSGNIYVSLTKDNGKILRRTFRG